MGIMVIGEGNYRQAMPCIHDMSETVELSTPRSTNVELWTPFDTPEGA